MSNAAWLENAAQTARQLCDSRGFRVGVAVFLGLPIGAFALAGGVFGGVALYGLLSGVRQAMRRPPRSGNCSPPWPCSASSCSASSASR
jgi:hypothetical protein